jgi:hypothetical protein
LVIGDKLDDAIVEARAIKERLHEVLRWLPPPGRLTGSQARLRDEVESSARLMSRVATLLDDPDRPHPNTEVILAEGRTVLMLVDDGFAMTGPNDPRHACPDVTYVPTPVHFPPPPTNAMLGLPQAVDGQAVTTHVGGITDMSDILEQLGADPASGREIGVQIEGRNGAVGMFDVIDAMPVDSEALVAALQANDAFTAGVTPTKYKASGFSVAAFVDPYDPSTAEHVAVRGGRIVRFHDFADPDVRAILAAMP